MSKDLTLMLLVLAAFGAWPLLAPHSYLRLVSTMNGGRVRLPRPMTMRVIGGLFLAAASSILIAIFR